MNLYFDTKSRFSQVIGVFVCLYFLLFPFQIWHSIPFAVQNSKFLFSVWECLFFLLLLVVFVYQNKVQSFKITPTDIWLSIAVLYLIIHVSFVKPIGLSIIQIHEPFILLSVYLSLRILPKSFFVPFLYVLVLTAVGQTTWGLLQHFDILPSFNDNFKITGGFFNPGPYAGYLASIFSSMVVFVFFIKRKKIHANQEKNDNLLFLIGCATISILLILYLIQSRAAWVAIIVTVSYFLWHLQLKTKLACSQKFKGLSHKGTLFLKTGIIFCLLAIAFILVLKAYQLRPDSANGRLLIWKCTLEMITSHPFSGVGVNQFKSVYMHFQTDWLNRHPNCPEMFLADNTVFCFNEYLKTTAETGVPGLLILLSLLLSALFCDTRADAGGYTAKAGLTSLMIFACFSYPFSVLTLKIYFFAFLAIISSRQKPVRNIPHVKWTKTLIILTLCIFLLIAIVNAFRVTKAFRSWGMAVEASNNEKWEDSNAYYYSAREVLKNDLLFIDNYTQILKKCDRYNEAITVLKTGLSIAPITGLYISTGNCHSKLGNYCEAEEAYLYAMQMLPTRARPVLELAKLYVQTDREKEAIQLITENFEQGKTKNTPETLKLKSEMRELLNEIRKEDK